MPETGRDQALDDYCNNLEQRTAEYRSKERPRDNLNPDLRKAMAQLRTLVMNRTIRINTADKGGKVVVKKTEDYIEEAHRQLYNPHHYQIL